MGIFRHKRKIQMVNLKASATRAIHQDRDFPLIELTFQVNRADAKAGDFDELAVTMTLWEANELLRQFMLIVSNTTRLQLPKPAVAIPWGEGQGNA